jgi:hypothetical protein
MTLEQLEAQLPNGFHDAYLGELDWDFQRREVKVVLYVLVGNDEQPISERYKKSVLKFRGCALVVVEPAVAYRAIKSVRGLQIDRTEVSEIDRIAIREAGYLISAENFWLAWFVYEWNSRLIINAEDVSFEFC